MKTGIELITEEREKQMKEWGIEHDIETHKDDELIKAAMFALTLEEEYEQGWDYENKLHIENSKQKLSFCEWKKLKLKIAGAFIIAELDRLIATE